MSSGPLYNIMLSQHRSSRNGGKQVEAYVIDRVPQGPLAAYVETQDRTGDCQPCGLMGGPRGIPDRHVIKLPAEVASVYRSPVKTDFVDTYTLPGFLTWCLENGYSTVDLKHVAPPEFGFWIEYTDSSSNEFRSLGAREPVQWYRGGGAQDVSDRSLDAHPFAPAAVRGSVGSRVGVPIARRLGVRATSRQGLRKR